MSQVESATPEETSHIYKQVTVTTGFDLTSTPDTDITSVTGSLRRQETHEMSLRMSRDYP